MGLGDGGVESGMTRLSWDLGFSEESLRGTVSLGRVVFSMGVFPLGLLKLGERQVNRCCSVFVSIERRVGVG